MQTTQLLLSNGMVMIFAADVWSKLQQWHCVEHHVHAPGEENAARWRTTPRF
jgi:hypothetical protein